MISPDLQNEKKVLVDAVHNMILLKEGVSLSHTFFSLCKIDDVMGRQGQGVLPSLPSWTLHPPTLALVLASDQFEDQGNPRLSESVKLRTSKF